MDELTNDDLSDPDHGTDRARQRAAGTRLLTDFRDELKAVVKDVNIAGMDNAARVRQIAQNTVDDSSLLMKPTGPD